MPDEELLKDIEKMLRIAKAAETSAMNFANGDKYVETTEKFAASLEKMKNFAVQKQPQLLRHVQHLETAFETTCYAEATPQATLEQYLL
ncbi:hypothetical protein T01_8291 [Trichinella spiralis]|uniref:Uncharacterized protein n=1 Tax=Trichinella spiralis TaxID=6334 RepID=A0A0V1AJV5_TRISP|nr:hypothetical protein T01_8291 [Trichinella spiralis]